MVRGDLPQYIRHQRNLLGLVGQYQVYKFLFLAISLDIKLGSYNFFKLENVVITDMPLVGAGVYGYALRAKTLAIFGNLYQIWIITTTRVTECGNFINIDR